jgi:glycerophosphoryl diester phosphodiesterase
MTEIASHRGGAGLWPENSRTAFENTAKLAVVQVEFDVHPSNDGQLVVIHDATLERTTDGRGPVCERSFAELSRLALKGSRGDRILSLPETISIFRSTPIRLRIEMKPGPGRLPYPGLPLKLVESLRHESVLDRTILTSFQIDTLCEATSLGRPSSQVWLITPEMQTDLGMDAICEIAKSRGVPMLGIRQNRLDANVVRKVRDAGLGIGGWAANDDIAIAKMFTLGVDVFTTDRPDLALEARDALREAALP